MTENCLIVGAGQAAAQAAHSLRQAGYDGNIEIFGEEPHPPYQRPPLSKKYLAGDLPTDRVWLRPSDYYESNGIGLRTGVRIDRIDPAAQQIIDADGGHYAYDKLLLATGTRARSLDLPGTRTPGVLPLRTMADVDRLRPLLSRPCRLAIIGGGYIGLEVAAVARELGHEVTVLEAQERVLNRVVAPALSSFYERVHSERGVTLRFGVQVQSVEGDGHVTGLRLQDGETVACDVVLVAVGAEPASELAATAGLEVDDGILVDAACRTSDARILAAGDCTRFPAARYGRKVRLESVQNAIDQAKAAASTLLGETVSYDPVPWFWSDQYEFKLQIAGLSQSHDETRLVGDPAAGSFYIAYLRDGHLLAVDSVNHPRSHMMARRALGEAWRDDLLPAA